MPYEFVGLMDHLNDRGLLDTGEYFVVGVNVGQHDSKEPQAYFKGINAILISPLIQKKDVLCTNKGLLTYWLTKVKVFCIPFGSTVNR